MDKIDVDKLHTTALGKERIKRNTGLDINEVIAWCKQADLSLDKEYVVQKGKNRYVYAKDYVLTIHAKSNTIITAHKRNEKTK
jgi:deoxycytidylate deaminase